MACPAVQGCTSSHQRQPIKIPSALVFSPHHSDLAVLVYAVVDMLSGRDRWGPATSPREWIAGRLDASVSGVAKALRQLVAEHTGADELVPDSPAYLVSTVRGRGRTALRDVIRTPHRVSVPQASLGDDAPAVSAAAWRLYVALLWLRHPEHQTVAHSRDDLAALLHRRPKTISVLLRELAAAGMVLTALRPGHTTLIAPLVTLDAAGRAAARDALDTALDDRREGVYNPAQGVRNCPDPVHNSSTGGAPAGTSGGAPAGTSGGAPAGTSYRGDPVYQDPVYQDPSSVPPPPLRGDGPTHPRRVVAAVVQLRPDELPAWCGRCPGPAIRDRVATDDEGRRTGAPCPACGPGAVRPAAAA